MSPRTHSLAPRMRVNAMAFLAPFFALFWVPLFFRAGRRCMCVAAAGGVFDFKFDLETEKGTIGGKEVTASAHRHHHLLGRCARECLQTVVAVAVPCCKRQHPNPHGRPRNVNCTKNNEKLCRCIIGRFVSWRARSTPERHRPNGMQK